MLDATASRLALATDQRDRAWQSIDEILQALVLLRYRYQQEPLYKAVVEDLSNIIDSLEDRGATLPRLPMS